MPQATDPVADLLPSRMLNEFVYCPRLFFYEHVEGVFVHNADTRRGAAQHTRVDSGSGALPKSRKKKTAEPSKEFPTLDDTAKSEQLPDANTPTTSDPIENPKPEVENEVIHARSVMLGSETLGVVAKLDLVEVTLPPSTNSEDQTTPRVCPVEYKAGAPREGTDGKDLWDTDRIQLGLQMMLLRENGYACDEGIVFYRQTRQRVRFILDTETEVSVRPGTSLTERNAEGSEVGSDRMHADPIRGRS